MRALALVSLSFLAAACATDPMAPPTRADAITAKAKALMASEDVKGLAFALIRDGEVEQVSAHGFRNVEKALPLTTDTIMYGASFTKTAFAYMVLQLTDEGVFDLDEPLAAYLEKPLPAYDRYKDLEGDDRWRRLTGRHVLIHATGFANFRWLEEDRKLRFHFEPGARYAYSGEGFNLLQFVLEEGLGLDVKEEMQARVFDRFDMDRTSMQWRPDFADNLADGYDMDGQFEPHDERSNVRAAGSMDTTIADQARMWAGIVSGDGLSPRSRAELVRAHLRIRSAKQFPTLVDSEDGRAGMVSLAAGLGLVTYQGTDGLSWFKGGHNDVTGNFVVCKEESRDCVVLMANSVRAELIYPELVWSIMDDPLVPFWWEYGHVE